MSAGAGSFSFDMLATVTAATKRSPAMSGDGSRAAQSSHLSNIRILPLDPIDADLLGTQATETPHELKVTYARSGLDIREGDVLVVATIEYPIRSVAEWTWDSEGDTLAIVVEQMKG